MTIHLRAGPEGVALVSATLIRRAYNALESGMMRTNGLFRLIFAQECMGQSGSEYGVS
jgi:hypothetical protein